MASTAGDDLASNGDPLPEQTARLVTDGIARVRAGRLRTDCPLLRIGDQGMNPFVMVWQVPDQTRRLNQRIVGFVADPSLVGDIFARILRESPLLPPSLGNDTRELLSVKVSSENGREIFSSSTAWSDYSSDTVLESELGDLRLSVALRPSAAERLIIGGLPTNRVPLLVGLLVLTTGLVIVALVQLRRERDLVRLRADFISGVSHELRTPVSQIRMFGETLLLDRVRSPEERRRSLSIIVQESQRLTRLIDNVLQFSCSDRDPSLVTLHDERLDLLLHEILDTFEPLAGSKRTSIARHIEEGIVASVDAGALRQIILNLLDNALKYGPPGQTVTITCRCELGAAKIGIEDEGPGVPPDASARIWEPFYRAASQTESTGGTGIGLAIVKQLVDLHQGRIRVERGSIGALFTIELPQASHVDAAPERQKSAAAGA